MKSNSLDSMLSWQSHRWKAMTVSRPSLEQPRFETGRTHCEHAGDIPENRALCNQGSDESDARECFHNKGKSTHSKRPPVTRQHFLQQADFLIRRIARNIQSGSAPEEFSEQRVSLIHPGRLADCHVRLCAAPSSDTAAEWTAADFKTSQRSAIGVESMSHSVERLPAAIATLHLSPPRTQRTLARNWPSPH